MRGFLSLGCCRVLVAHEPSPKLRVVVQRGNWMLLVVQQHLTKARLVRAFFFACDLSHVKGEDQALRAKTPISDLAWREIGYGCSIDEAGSTLRWLRGACEPQLE